MNERSLDPSQTFRDSPTHLPTLSARLERVVPAPLHPREGERLDSLYRHALLDTPQDGRFQRLVCTALQIFRVKIASISAIDADRQYFKAAIGTPTQETSRDLAFCAHTILEDRMMIVEDAYYDERFEDHPFVIGSPFIRFYAGVPLLSRTGLPLGTLCVIDTEPRTFSKEQQHLLRLLSREAQELIQSTAIEDKEG